MRKKSAVFTNQTILYFEISDSFGAHFRKSTVYNYNRTNCIKIKKLVEKSINLILPRVNVLTFELYLKTAIKY